MVPADGNFTTAIAKGNHKAGEIQGQTRQHSRLINLLGVKQINIGVNKMDFKVNKRRVARTILQGTVLYIAVVFTAFALLFICIRAVY